MYKIIFQEFSYPVEYENILSSSFETLEDACKWLGENIEYLMEYNPIEKITIKWIK